MDLRQSPPDVAEAAHSLAALGVRVPSVRTQLGELYGGQRQGVAIARAVRENNPIVLIDEPTAALGVRKRHTSERSSGSSSSSGSA